MEIPIAYDNASATAEELALYLKDVEGRSGVSSDIRAVTVGGKKKTVTRHNILVDPPATLFLVVAGKDPPEGAKLDYAGTAFIEDKEVVVAIYR